MPAMRFDDRPDDAKRLEKARRARGMASAKAAAEFFGWSPHTYIQHENGTRGFRRAAARYAAAFRVSEAWLLTGEGPPPPSPRLPVMGIAAGAITGQNIVHETPLEFVGRPPALEGVPDAYALWVRGSSMSPRFAEGDLVIVHPHRQPRPGDAIVIQQIVNGAPVAFIKELVRRSDRSVVARQYSPPATLEYPAQAILHVHKVLTTHELFAM